MSCKTWNYFSLFFQRMLVKWKVSQKVTKIVEGLENKVCRKKLPLLQTPRLGIVWKKMIQSKGTSEEQIIGS